MADYTRRGIPGSAFCIYPYRTSQGYQPAVGTNYNTKQCDRVKDITEVSAITAILLVVYLLTDDYVSTEDNSLYVYYNAVRSGTGSRRFPSVSTVI